MNTNARLALLAAILISLTVSGCKKESPAPAPSTDDAVALEPAATGMAAASADLPLPGLKPTFPYQVQSDSTYTQAKTGQLRRAVVLEFKEGDLRTAFGRTADALKGIGYSTKAMPMVSDDVISQSFYGRGGIYLEARKSLGAHPKDQASVGVIALSWPIKSVEEPVPLVQ